MQLRELRVELLFAYGRDDYPSDLPLAEWFDTSVITRLNLSFSDSQPNSLLKALFSPAHLPRLIDLRISHGNRYWSTDDTSTVLDTLRALGGQLKTLHFVP